ncbi:MAG: hypothetical protein U0T77_02855 [Chitinophagales bacterium]
MKKLTYLAFAAMVLLGSVSCKKDYTCECKNPTTGAVVSSTKILKSILGVAVPRDEAVALCDAEDNLLVTGNEEKDCSLK